MNDVEKIRVISEAHDFIYANSSIDIGEVYSMSVREVYKKIKNLLQYSKLTDEEIEQGKKISEKLYEFLDAPPCPFLETYSDIGCIRLFSGESILLLSHGAGDGVNEWYKIDSYPSGCMWLARIKGKWSVSIDDCCDKEAYVFNGDYTLYTNRRGSIFVLEN